MLALLLLRRVLGATHLGPLLEGLIVYGMKATGSAPDTQQVLANE